MSWTWCNGDFFDGPLAVSPTDRGLTNGLGLFETVLAIGGSPLALDLHLARLNAGAARLGWEVDAGEIALAIPGLLDRCGLAQEGTRARVRIAITAGAGDLRDLARGVGALAWITAFASPVPPESLSLVTATFPRNERSPLAGLKCASYAENLFALDAARRAGADEPLFYNTRGDLCESATMNVFVVKDGVALTPPLSSGCLPGTMRERVICQIPVREADLTAEDITSADEVFLSSAIRGVVPVSAIDGRLIPTGPVAERLRRTAWDRWT
ncbi:aminotransferase class IV [Luteolibacter flavescens]|uniref:branched-chain-amino-acid transaminase n=1 Tax=Luteolibacter flavescens TaxID=1859460 RepID=A0ABT3FTV0_9BACT|nr:aminotransferase class IV [Luteolibacter flavescens]MCW1886654.1 aminotransferase class IV [Luteolibacter flavescens]